MKPDADILEKITACSGCDMLLPAIDPAPGHTVLCPRCGTTIKKRSSHSILKVLALSITGLLLYFPSIFLPLMTFESFGFHDSASIVDSIIIFFQNDYFIVSSMVLLSALVLPALLLILIFTVSFNLYRENYPSFLPLAFKAYIKLEEWAMVEVYLLGVMITVIKMKDSADIQYHIGLFCFSALVLISMAITTMIDREIFWQTIERGEKKQFYSRTRETPLTLCKEPQVSANRNGLALCHTCHKLSPSHLVTCPRCGDRLHSRKNQSIPRTWALVLTSALFLVPANLLPIMRVDLFGIPDRSTILDGIIYFFHNGSWFIGMIIFTASILVPVFKIVGLLILLLSTRPCSRRFLRKKTKMFHFIAFIGRWSMLDIFVIALLSALVDFGFFSSVQAAPAATYFCLVVAATMGAAITFDPRIMWDRCFSCTKKKED
ncbi:paraquat-inducible protein A [Desulfomarina profundi]|uniref:Paraquat-inducible protein A n=1 Tax=Desulfomarina profundi TaxID=2772557 RepID=A0A8D5FZK2_9BACT|nr:paraquat-inducible protein A [Desulfomarina profundi]BCL62822.1 paraquat-inducible protein A [Desulfomarina profundi]